MKMDVMKKRAMMWGLIMILSVAGSLIIDSLLNFSPLALYIRLLGIPIVLGSFYLLRISGRALKKYGMKESKKFGETDTLVTEGIYSRIRHPHHTGIMLFFIGFGLLLGSLSFVIIATPMLILLVVIFVLKVEEPEAIKKFGDAYIEYSKKVPRFIPRIRCREEEAKKLAT